MRFDPLVHFPKYHHAYLVGKGPSLDRLSPDHFPDPKAPVIAINEAIHPLEKLNLPNPIFCIQQDASLGSKCRPKYSKWIVSRQALKASGADVAINAFSYVPEDIGHSTTSLTGMVAITLLHQAHYSSLTMLAFDAHFGNVNYAPSIGHSHIKKGQKDDRFIRHDERMEKQAREYGMSMEWTPPAPGWELVTLCVRGGIYHKGHVDAVRENLSANIRNPFTFHVIGDDPSYATIPVKHNWKGWFSKLELFRERLFTHNAPILYFDLDTFFSRPFTLPLASTMKPGTIYARVDGWRPKYHHTGMMAFLSNTITEPYEWYARNQNTKLPGDEEIICQVMGNRFADLDQILIARSYKIDKPYKKDVDVVYFHGKPKPWDPELGWMKVKGTIKPWIKTP